MLFITASLPKFLLRLIGGIGALLFLVPAQAANIDCDKATTRTEAAICASAELLKLDQDLDATYQNLLDSNPSDAMALTYQRAWITSRDGGCRSNRACLIATYEDRIKELKRLIDVNAALDGI
jgi:uncharacterized protein